MCLRIHAFNQAIIEQKPVTVTALLYICNYTGTEVPGATLLVYN